MILKVIGKWKEVANTAGGLPHLPASVIETWQKSQRKQSIWKSWAAQFALAVCLSVCLSVCLPNERTNELARCLYYCTTYSTMRKKPLFLNVFHIALTTYVLLVLAQYECTYRMPEKSAAKLKPMNPDSISLEIEGERELNNEIEKGGRTSIRPRSFYCKVYALLSSCSL